MRSRHDIEEHITSTSRAVSFQEEILLDIRDLLIKLNSQDVSNCGGQENSPIDEHPSDSDPEYEQYMTEGSQNSPEAKKEREK